MEPKFTPGPYRVVMPHDGDNDTDNIEVHDGFGRTATVYGEMSEETGATAQLLAAAPALYRELARLLEHADRVDDRNRSQWPEAHAALKLVGPAEDGQEQEVRKDYDLILAMTGHLAVPLSEYVDAEHVVSHIQRLRDRVAAKLSRAFVEILEEWLSRAEFDEMRRRNAAETDDNVCHSHDFCDANMAMMDAFETMLGREIDLQSDADIGIWNMAWKLAAPQIRTAP